MSTTKTIMSTTKTIVTKTTKTIVTKTIKTIRYGPGYAAFEVIASLATVDDQLGQEVKLNGQNVVGVGSLHALLAKKRQHSSNRLVGGEQEGVVAGKQRVLWGEGGVIKDIES